MTSYKIIIYTVLAALLAALLILRAVFLIYPHGDVVLPGTNEFFKTEAEYVFSDLPDTVRSRIYVATKTALVQEKTTVYVHTQSFLLSFVSFLGILVSVFSVIVVIIGIIGIVMSIGQSILTLNDRDYFISFVALFGVYFIYTTFSHLPEGAPAEVMRTAD